MLKRSAPREALWFLLLALVALVVTASYAREPYGMRGNPRSRFREMVAGTAHRPYVKRVVVPLAVRAIGSRFDADDRAEIDSALDARHPVTRVLDHVFAGWERDLAPEYVAAFALMWAFFVGFACAFRLLLTAVYRAPPWLERVAPPAALLGLVPSFEPYASYLYDPPLLCLHTLALALLARRRFGLYLAAFSLAALNKETAILLALVFYLVHVGDRGLPNRSFLLLLCAQAAIWAAIAGGLAIAYSDNPGGAVEWRLLRNLFLLPRFGLGAAAGALLIALLVARDWTRKPAFLRAALAPLLPLAALAFAFGYFDELRDYYEVYPAVLLLLMPTALGLAGVELAPRAESGR